MSAEEMFAETSTTEDDSCRQTDRQRQRDREREFKISSVLLDVS